MNQSISASKRGNVAIEVTFIVVVLFVIALVGLFSFQILDNMIPDLDEAIDNPNATAIYTNYHDRNPAWFDSAFLLMVILFWIGAMASAFFIDTHPVFFMVSVVLLIVTMVVGGFLANTYIEIAGDSGVGGEFPLTSFVYDHFIGFILGISASILLVLYAKVSRS